MPTFNDTKVTFVGVDANQKKLFKQQHAVLLISLWQKNPEKSDAFKATLKLSEQHFEKITILVVDSLQQHNIKWQSNELSGFARQMAKKLGDDWIIENLPAINEIAIPYKIKRWDEFLMHPDFHENHEYVANAIEISPELKSTFLKDERDYFKRIENDNIIIPDGSFQNGMDYLLEEAAVFLMMEKLKQYDVILYPAPSLGFFYPLLKHQFPNYKLQWIELHIETKKRHSRVGVMERSIKRSVDLYFQILTLLPSHFYWLDKNNHYLGCSDLQAEAFGLKSNLDIIGRSNADFFNVEEAKRLDDINLKVMRERQAHELEETVHFQGEFRTFISKKIPLYSDKNEVIGLLGISIDITERKKIENDLLTAKEKAEQGSIAKSRFLAMASHELRTPLNGILGFAELLSEANLSPEHKEYVNYIRKSGNHLLSIITDILDFTKLEVNKQTAQMDKFDLKLLIKEAISMTKHLMEEKPLLISLSELDEYLPNIMLSDSFKIKQIIINLISNAIKFTDKGFIKIKACCEIREDNCALLKISVQDTGVGISKDKFEMIFQEFEQAEGGIYMRRYGGMGLGLAICRQFVELLKGKIWVESMIGEGSTFHVHIPIEIIEKNHSLKKIEPLVQDQPEEKIISNAKILSVEDNPIAQKMMVFMLTNLGYQLDTANTAKEALEKLERNAYDIVFMDIQLPDGSGDKITKVVRDGDGLNKNTMIIALTAHVHPDEKVGFLKAGMNKVLEKPMSKESLAKEIEAVMKSQDLF